MFVLFDFERKNTVFEVSKAKSRQILEKYCTFAINIGLNEGKDEFTMFFVGMVRHVLMRFG